MTSLMLKTARRPCSTRSTFCRLMACCLLSVFFVLPSAQDVEAAKDKSLPKAKPKKELVLSSNPVVLMDVETGKVLYHRDANQKWYPASLTKLMTAYVAFRALRAGEISLDTALTVSRHALSYPPSKMGFPVGTQVTVENALKMVLVKSANDISAALGERIAGSEARFVMRMNDEARRLGMNATHFVNANGLFKPDQTSSARDMAVLTRQILMEFPEHRSLFTIPAIRHGKRVLRSYNRLLETFRGSDGMKTGFVCSSGYNIVASASRNGRQLVAVVMGAPNVQVRAETAAFLLTKGFEQKNLMQPGFPTISQSSSLGPISAPFDMRPEVCPKGGPRWVPNQDYDVSYLEPRFKLMDPVRVYAGGRKKKQRIVLPNQLPALPMDAPLAKVPDRIAKTRLAGMDASPRAALSAPSRLPRPKP